MKLLSRTEEMLLLVVCRLQADAYALDIRREVEDLTGQHFSVGGIYVPLDRLVKKGLLLTEAGSTTEGRQGRPRKRYQITDSGLKALSEIKALSGSMWGGMPEALLRKLTFT